MSELKSESQLNKQWRRGKTLLTKVTSDWTQLMFEQNDAREQTMIFDNFREEDKGKGRRLICKVMNDHPDYQANAQLIADAPRLQQSNAELVEALKEIVDIGNTAISNSYSDDSSYKLECTTETIIELAEAAIKNAGK